MAAYPSHMTSWPDLGALELLVAVADHGSLSAGARAAGVAQPNASRSVARLERQLGVALLHRSTRGSTLTPAGLLVVDWSRQVVAAAGRLREGVAALATDGDETLAVTASQTVAEHLLPAWLAALRGTAARVRVSVDVRNSQETVAQVLAGRCDLGFVEGPRPPRGVHHLVVAHDELVLVVAADHPWAARRSPVSRAELSGTPLVTRERGSGTRVALDAAVGHEVPAAVELPSNAAVRVGVRSGAGPAVLSRLAVADALADGTLLEVPTELDLCSQLRAVWTGPRRLQGAAADLVTHARAGGAG